MQITQSRFVFSHVKLETLFYRDLSQVKAEVSRSARTIQSAAMSVEKAQRGSLINQTTLDDEQTRREKVSGCICVFFL